MVLEGLVRHGRKVKVKPYDAAVVAADEDVVACSEERGVESDVSIFVRGITQWIKGPSYYTRKYGSMAYL